MICYFCIHCVSCFSCLVPKYFEIFNQQQNEHAEDEYDPLQFYQSYQLEWPQPSMVDWNTLNLSPGLKLNFDAENTDKAPPLPVKKKTLVCYVVVMDDVC